MPVRLLAAVLSMLVLLCAPCLPGRAIAQQPVTLTDARDVYAIGSDVALLRDAERSYTIDDVTRPPTAGRFVRGTDAAPSRGYDTAAYWLRLRLRDATTAPKAWLLEVSNKSLDEIAIFTPTAHGVYTARRTGDALPFETREIRNRAFLFRLPFDVGAEQTVYLRIASHGPLYAPIRILSEEAYLQGDRVAQFALGAFFGILLVMAVFNLLLYATIRDAAYLYYVLFIATFLAYQVSVERVGFEYLWPDNLWWAARANSTLALVCAVFGIQFSRSFLRTGDFLPRWDRLLGLLEALCLPLIVVHFVIAAPALNRLAVLFFIVIASVLVTVGLTCVVRGSLLARYYLIAWSFLLAGILLKMLGYLDVIPPQNVVSVYGVQIGAALQVTLFSLGLGHRYNTMRRARERLRLRIARDLHDDIGSGLTQISLFSELLRTGPETETTDLAERIGTQARSLAGTMQDIVWAVETERGTWEALELRMKDYAAGLLAPAGVAFDMQGQARDEHADLPFEVRQNVLLMFKEILHNAVKHAGATRVTVRWTLTRRTLHIAIEDDGAGFDPEAVRRGNGLKNLRRRAAAIGATLTLQAKPGAPTRIEIVTPLIRAPQPDADLVTR